MGKFHIHKAKFSRSLPNINVFLVELNIYLTFLRLMTNRKSVRTMVYYDDLFSISPDHQPLVLFNFNLFIYI